MENDLNKSAQDNSNEKEKKDKLEIILEENNCNISEENNNQEKDKEKKSSTSSKNSNSNKKNNLNYSPKFLFEDKFSPKKINIDNLDNNGESESLSKKNLNNDFIENNEINKSNDNTIKYLNSDMKENENANFKNNNLDLIGYNLIQNQIKIFNENEQLNNNKEIKKENNDVIEDENNENINIDNEYLKNENNNNYPNYLSDENKIASDNNDSGFNIINNHSENENYNINNTPEKKNKNEKENNIEQSQNKDNIKINEDNLNENQINVLYSYEGYVNNDNDNEENKDNNINNNLNGDYYVIENVQIDNIPNDNTNKEEKISEDKDLKKKEEEINIKENNSEKENENNEIKKETEFNNIEIKNNEKQNENTYENNTNKEEIEEIPSDNNKLNISMKHKENKEVNKQNSSKKGALKILELLMSKKKEKKEIDKKNEEIMIETFQRARSKNLLETDSFTDKIKNNNKDNYIEENNDKDLKENINEDNSKKINENEEHKENKIEKDTFKEEKKEKEQYNTKIQDEKKDIEKNENKDNIEINEEKKPLLNNEIGSNEQKNSEEKNINLNNEKKESNNKTTNNNLKINIINPNRIYKKNSKKMISKINSDKSNKNMLYNTNSFSKTKNDNNSKTIIPNVTSKYSNNNIKSQRNNSKKEIMEINKNSKSIDIITNKNPKNAQIEIEDPHTKSIPISNYNQYEKEIFEKNKKLKKNEKSSIKINDEEHSMMNLYNKNYGPLENSFDAANIYKKRKLNQHDFSQSPTARIYAPKRALNQRVNSLGKLKTNNPNPIISKSNININNVNYINNINTIIKNKNDESLISMAYAKKSPIPNRKENIIRLNNSINVNHYMNNEYNNHENNNINNRNSNDNYDRYNKNINNNNYNIINNYNYNNIMNNNINNKQKKKYLMASKTSSMLKKRRPIPKYDDMNLSNDNINLNINQNQNIKKRNNNFNNYNYMNNNIGNKTNNNLYNNRNYSNTKISNNPQRTKRKNQVIPSIYQNKQNNSLSQRYFAYNNFNNTNNNFENNYYSINNYNNNNIDNRYNSFRNNYIEDNDGNDIGSYYITNNNYNINKKQNLSISINIEDLMVLEEKLSEIIYFLKNRKEVNNQCFDFWNYFYNCSLYQRIEKTFKTKNNIEIVKFSINLELLSVMLCYEISYDQLVLNKTYILLLEILELNHRNLMIICENILIKISPENQTNRWVLKLNKIVQNSKMNEQNNYENLSFIEKIEINSDKINKKLLNILLNYKTECSQLIMSLMKKITQKNYEEINDFFREYILKVENLENSIVASVLLKTSPNFISHRPPYLHTPRNKPYTLILDLNETLVSFQQTNYSQGILRLRPFLIEFLEEISYYYELILFTASTEYFAKPIINAIEEHRKYFDFIFYRECCIIIGNDFVKDLTRIGRPLDSTIIVDNMQQNFRLQKENGINIKPFYAQDPNDSALYDLLNILIDIAGDEGDVREGLAKYRNEIVKKVTSNISKYNI